jgi:hypothetical protein
MRALKTAEVFNHQAMSSPCVSIYLSQEGSQNSLRREAKLKNLFKEAHGLMVRDLGASRAQGRIASMEEALYSWLPGHPNQGFGYFSSDDINGYVSFPWRGPDFVVVATSFHTKPLIRWLQDPRRFYLLTLSRGGVKLFSGDAKTLSCIETFMISDEDEKFIQKDYGYSIENRQKRKENDAIQKHFKEVARKLQRYFDRERMPLIIGGPTHLRKAFQKNFFYPYLIDEALDGIFDSFTTEKLQDLAIKTVSSHIEREQIKVVESFKRNHAVTSLDQITRAALEGRVERLLVAEDEQIWGILDEQKGLVQAARRQRNTKDDDILDDLSEQVLSCRGEVFVIPQEKMPKDSQVCALLRW